MTHPWGSADIEDREYFDADPHRHDVPDTTLADKDWSRTLAALDGDGGDAIYRRMDLDDEAFWDDFEEDAR